MFYSHGILYLDIMSYSQLLLCPGEAPWRARASALAVGKFIATCAEEDSSHMGEQKSSIWTQTRAAPSCRP